MNPPLVPIKLPKNKFKTGTPKSVPDKNVPIKDITTARIIAFLFKSSNFFKIPIRINAKAANINISTQKSNKPPAIGKRSALPKRAPATKWGMKNSNILTKIPKGIT